jgi:hypothetical protein
MPWRIQEQDGRTGTSAGRPSGGVYKRIGRNYLRDYWRATRAAVRVSLRTGREPPPTRPRHSAQWDYW